MAYSPRNKAIITPGKTVHSVKDTEAEKNHHWVSNPVMEAGIGGMVASWLVLLSPNQVDRVQGLVGDIVLFYFHSASLHPGV